ncbi:MAG: tRNA 2-thiocytidine biosynthesis TtcA family protein [Tepidibacter sp.]|jgi:tRNA(Ile)-lysidine synthase TilS/MesJ|uniref:tRNA 2-thiocytidine biosynthesis TtcA family protein n=1 Tax=Tepidibacter sp. TaxID=2529387 RepID=UPI0025E92C6A|nr:tRNA 2-thiocytidine biosynthesis TtcA family protein [Tepidibacter sp.]MCT4509072.1 tRNA 2-thiocytidine biosynthesis TtcA family protein [Tepidibacter sp.]
MKKILGKIRRACNDYNMIQDNDKIAVGFSGGKDSIALIYALKLFQRFSPNKFELEAITVDPGFDNMNLDNAKKFLREIDVPYTIIKTDIAQIVFDERKESNPCSLCSKMRRGALNDHAKKRGINKIALGHHLDDGISTLFLSMFYEGRMNTFKPVTYLDRMDITTIRPLIYITEKSIIEAVKRNNLPVLKSPCPVDGKTKREFANTIVNDIADKVPDFKKRMLKAMQNKDQTQLWFKPEMFE